MVSKMCVRLRRVKLCPFYHLSNVQLLAHAATESGLLFQGQHIPVTSPHGFAGDSADKGPGQYIDGYAIEGTTNVMPGFCMNVSSLYWYDLYIGLAVFKMSQYPAFIHLFKR
jgi:hypothetical protein